MPLNPPQLPPNTRQTGQGSPAADEDLLATAAGLAVYAANNGTDFADPGATLANLFVSRSRGVPTSSTTYNPGDVLVYRGGRILVTTTFTTGTIAAGTFPFISAANYVLLDAVDGSRIKAADYGVIGDSTTDNGAVLNALIQAVSANGGGNIDLPPGNVMTSVPIVIYSNVAVWGCGMGGVSELRLLANANCDVVQFYRSSDAVISNAFFAGLWNVQVNGNRNSQGVTDFHSGVNITTNPATATATSDPDFDPTHILFNVQIKNTTGHGYYHSGRSGVRLIGVYVLNPGGDGFISSFDTEFVACHVEAAGLAGWYINHSSIRGVGCKSYNNGRNAPWVSGTAYVAGNYVTSAGVLYRCAVSVTSATAPASDSTHWTSVWTQTAQAGYGYYWDVNGNGQSWAGCDAQQNAAGSYYLKGASGINLTGSADQLNTGLGTAGAVNNSTNPSNYAVLTLDAAYGNVVSLAVASSDHAYVLRLLNGATGNNVTVASDNTEASAVSPDSTAVAGSGNSVLLNGTSISSPVAQVLFTLGAPASGFGANGNYAADFAAQTWYGPKTSGAWPSGFAFGTGGGHLKIQTGTANLQTSGGTATASFGFGATAGNLLVGVATVFPLGATVTPPSGFTQMGSTYSGPSAVGQLMFYAKIAAGGETSFAWSATGTGMYSQFFVTEYSWTGGAVVIDGAVVGAQGTTSTSLSLTYGSSVTTGGLAVVAYTTSNGTASTAPTGWSTDWSVNNLVSSNPASDDGSGLYFQTTGTTAPTGTFTWTGSSTYAGAMIVLKV